MKWANCPQVVCEVLRSAKCEVPRSVLAIIITYHPQPTDLCRCVCVHVWVGVVHYAIDTPVNTYSAGANAYESICIAVHVHTYVRMYIQCKLSWL